MGIAFFSESDFDVTEMQGLGSGLTRVARMEGYKLAHVSYVFCGDAYLLDLNKRYLNHDFYTDVIAFDYSSGKGLQADIFVSVERVGENAKAYGVSFSAELCRVAVHGLLHLMGYGDQGDWDAQVMRAKEDFYIDSLRDRCST